MRCPFGSGPVPEVEPMAWSRPEKVAVILLVVDVLLSLAFLVHPWYDTKNDAAMYIVTARSIAAGEGYSALGMPFHLRPPGFSLLIVPIIGILGTDFYALNLLVSLFGAAGVVLLFLYQRTRIGWVLALLVAIAVWLNPSYQRYCNQVMSDVPGATLVLLCLLFDRRVARSPSARGELALGALIGLAAYVRSINLLLLPAILASRLFHRLERGRPVTPWIPFFARRFGIVIVGAWIVLFPWSIRNHLLAQQPPVDQTQIYDYSTAMFHEDRTDPRSPRLPVGQILQRVPERSVQISSSLVTRMQDTDRASSRGLAAVILACSLSVLVKRRAPADFFVLGTLVVLGVYFAYQDRLILPAYLLILPAVVEALRDLVRRLAGPRVATATLAAALVLLIAVDFKPRQSWEDIENQHRDFEQLCSEIEASVAPDARLASGGGWHYSMFLERPVYTLKHAVRRAGEVDVVEELIDRYRLDTIVLLGRTRMERRLMRYFEQHYGEIEKVGSLTLVRVRPPRTPPSR